MSPLRSVTLTGASGTPYTLDVYPLREAPNPTGTVYALAHDEVSVDPSGQFVHRYRVLYIGYARRPLRAKLIRHPARACYRAAGANCLFVQEANGQCGPAYARDLIEGVEPSCID